MLAAGCWLLAAGSAFAQNLPPEETLEGKVIDILQEKQIETEQSKVLSQRLEVLITRGSKKGERIIFDAKTFPEKSPIKYKKGNRLLITYTRDFEGKEMYLVTDFIRKRTLLLLFSVFVLLALFVARWQGLTSLIGMGLSFLVILKFVLPQLLLGKSPLLVATLASLVLIPITFYVSHGLNKKTTVGVIATLIALLITIGLAALFTSLAKLSGLVSEEAGFIQNITQKNLNVRGLLLAGIIIGSVGILDDITIAQAAVVEKLSQAKKLGFKRLYGQAMEVGRDHVASMVNTLVLVYTGASLPLLLLFINNPHPFTEVVNYEIVAEEIIRTLVSSIGLILAVPITTFLAAAVSDKK